MNNCYKNVRFAQRPHKTKEVLQKNLPAYLQSNVLVLRTKQATVSVIQFFGGLLANRSDADFVKLDKDQSTS